jgi:hypothetical protein
MGNDIPEFEQEPDTVFDPLDIVKRMKLAGSDNDTDNNQFMGGDEVDLLGDGVPGYETTGVPESNDDTELHIEEKYAPTLTPTPKKNP